MNDARALKISSAVASGENVPRAWLIDARRSGLDESQFVARARALNDEAGIQCVSRSYRYPYALVAWHDAPVGIDIERIEPCAPAFAESICTPAERADPAFHTLNTSDIISIWCSKEALAKALGDATQYDPRRLESPIRWVHGQTGPWHAAPLTAPENHTVWLCWRTSLTVGRTQNRER